MATKARETVSEVTGDAPTPRPAVGLPELPKVKESQAEALERRTVLLYGPAGIGKSTMASEWAGGTFLFLDTAGELRDLEVYRMPVTDWTNFRAACASYAGQKHEFGGVVIDTADMLGIYCAQWTRDKLGVVHQSDAEWGKGWDLLKETFISHLAKLAALPGGLILVSHSRDIEIKTRTEAYNKAVPTLTGGVRDACVNMADLVLFVDYDDSGGRVIKTKPGKYHDAKERGRTPRLPEEIAWPVGASGWDVLREAWGEKSPGK